MYPQQYFSTAVSVKEQAEFSFKSYQGVKMLVLLPSLGTFFILPSFMSFFLMMNICHPALLFISVLVVPHFGVLPPS